jgi:LacI family transcriptional regulator
MSSETANLEEAIRVVKIVDVAREAGVAPSTVSRALNNHPSVGPEYVERVRRAAELLGYRPNGVARNLRRQSTDVIALIVPDVGNNFCTAVTRGTEDVAREAGLSVLLCNSDEDPVREARYLDVIEREKVAGVLLSPHGPHTDVSRLIAARVPVVAIDRRLAGDIDAVTTDSFAGAVEATRHFYEQGWLRPGCCAGPEGVETADWRLAGYLDAVATAGGVAISAHGSYDREGGASAAAALLDGPGAPDSILVSNEQMALGVLAELHRRNLRPGVDIGVLTFDDTPWAPLMNPPMTVIEQPAYEVGARAARMLIDRIRGEAPPGARHVTLPTRLIVRESSLRASSR